MTAIGVSICDTCGRRMPQGKEGNLVLQRLVRSKDTYTKTRNIRNWTCCKDCVNKFTGLKMVGDFIRDDIEILIDEYCGKREKKILSKNKKKTKNFIEVLAE